MCSTRPASCTPARPAGRAPTGSSGSRPGRRPRSSDRATTRRRTARASRPAPPRRTSPLASTPRGTSAANAEPRAGPRDTGSLLDRLRKRRLVDLLRARRHRCLRARPDAARLRDRRRHLRADGRHVRGGNGPLSRRRVARRASPGTGSTKASASGRPGRSCSSTSRRSRPPPSSCRTTWRSSGSRSGRTPGTSSSAQSSSSSSSA